MICVDVMTRFAILSRVPPPAARALLILATALSLRVIYYISISRTACLDINLDPISDMEAFHRWASTIVDGDWLGRKNFHPFHPWQIAVAAREQWDLWYGNVFHQEPLYAYLIAALYLVLPRQPSSVILLQLVLGASGCAFVYLAARRVTTEGASLVAGIMSSLYGPYLFYESLLLRDSLMIPLNALLIWVVLEARARSDTQRGKSWWAVVGMLSGVLFIIKATTLLFFILLMVMILWETRNRPFYKRMVQPLMMLAAFGVVFSPLVARNLLVGAPAMVMTTRGPIEFINGNSRWHTGVGWFDGSDERVSAYARHTLAQAGGRLLPTATIVLSDWSSNPIGFLRLQMLKTGYFLAPFEEANNASYSYFKENSALLRSVPSFYWISPLALIGLLASFRRWKDFAPLYLFLAIGSAVTILFYVIARFRAPFMPVIMIFAAVGVWSIVAHAKAGRLWKLSISCLLVAAGLAVNTVTKPKETDLVRPQDYIVAIKAYRSRGRLSNALEQAERARKVFPALAPFHRAAGMLYEQQGHRREALAAFREALARNPSHAETRKEVLRLERELTP